MTYELYLRAECGHAERTINGYLDDLRIVGAWLVEHTGRTLDAATYDDLIAWIQAATRAGKRGSTIARRISAVKSRLKFHGRELIANRLTRPKRSHRLRQIPNVAEMRRFLESAADPRDRAALEVLYGTGLRNAELCALTVADVAGDCVRVRNGKGGKDRQIPLNPQARAALAAWLATRLGAKPADLLFVRKNGRPFNGPFVYRLILHYAKKSRQRVPMFPHLLRHAFASHLLAAGVNLRYIQEWLGHSDIKATQVYLHYDIVDVRAMVLRCLPRERIARGEPAEVPVQEIIRPPLAAR